jgi:predicted nucleotidyltransferase
MYSRTELLKFAGDCARTISAETPAMRAVLIGSVVKGTVHPHSDIDIVVEGLPALSYFKILGRLHEIIPDDLSVDLIPYEKAFEGIKTKADTEGVVLYERRS